MKKNKLLSIGAAGLAIVCFTSAGVFAADNILSTTQKDVLKGIIKTYNEGKNPINNLDANKNTKLIDIINQDSDEYKKIEEKLNSYNEGSKFVTAIKDGTISVDILKSSLIYASMNKENFDSYKAMVNDVVEQLIDIDKTTDSSARIAKEQKAAEMINASYGTVKFGKNSEGNTTLSLENKDQIILQVNTSTANKLVEIINSFNSYDEFENFLLELGIN